MSSFLSKDTNGIYELNGIPNYNTVMPTVYVGKKVKDKSNGIVYICLDATNNDMIWRTESKPGIVIANKAPTTNNYGVGYDIGDIWVFGTKRYKMTQNANSNAVWMLSTLKVPDTNFNESHGYSVGDKLIHEVTGEIYQCAKQVGDAIWSRTIEPVVVSSTGIPDNTYNSSKGFKVGDTWDYNNGAILYKYDGSHWLITKSDSKPLSSFDVDNGYPVGYSYNYRGTHTYVCVSNKSGNAKWSLAEDRAPTANDDTNATPKAYVGMLWLDKTTNKMYKCTDDSAGAAQWDLISSDTSGGSGADLRLVKSSPTLPTTRDDGSALQADDSYFEPTLHKTVVYDGTKWKVEDQSTGEYLGNFDNGHIPTANNTGDRYANTDTGKMMKWDGANWIDSNAASGLADDSEFSTNRGSTGTSDLDSLNKNGHYQCTNASDATSARHYPVANKKGTLNVSTGNGIVKQTYITEDGAEYVRINSGSGFTSWAKTTNDSVPDASETVKGKIQIASQSTVDTGTDDTMAVTPKKLKATLGNSSSKTYIMTRLPNALDDVDHGYNVGDAQVYNGIIRICTNNDSGAPIWKESGTYNDANETTKGIAQVATQAEVDAGTDDTRIVTPKKLESNRLFYRERGDNLLINPEFRIWQRTTSYDPSSQRYGADRWWTYASPAGQTISQDTNSYGQGFAMKIHTAGGTNNATVDVRQGIELTNNRPLTFNGNGKLTMNVAFKYPSGSQFTIELYYADNMDLNNDKAIYTNTINANGSLQIASVTFDDTMPNNGNKIIVLCIGGGKANSDHFIYHVELLEGSREPTFHSRPYSQELSMCQRYYYNHSSSSYFLKYVDSDNYYFSIIEYPTKMYRAPDAEAPVSSDATNITLMQMFIGDSNLQVYATTSDGTPVKTAAAIYYAKLDAEMY